MEPEGTSPGQGLTPGRLMRAIPGVAFSLRLARNRLFASLMRRQRFNDWYARNYWGDPESRSGRGSNLIETQAVRAALPPLCRQLGIGSLLDIPCGDFNWMRHVALGTVNYTGADIVAVLAKTNQQRYGQSGRSFITMDIVRTVPERFDLVLCRDLMGHLPDRDITRALHNLRRSGSAWLLTTTFPERRRNEDLGGRDWRPVNLQLPPFALPAPSALLTEDCPELGYEDKSLGLWSLTELA